MSALLVVALLVDVGALVVLAGAWRISRRNDRTLAALLEQLDRLEAPAPPATFRAVLGDELRAAHQRLYPAVAGGSWDAGRGNYAQPIPEPHRPRCEHVDEYGRRCLVVGEPHDEGHQYEPLRPGAWRWAEDEAG